MLKGSVFDFARIGILAQCSLRLVKWPRKRPRDPGGIADDSSTSNQDLSQSPPKHYRFFKKPVVPQHGQSALNNRVEHRSSLALEIASVAAKTLLLASDAPVIGVLKPFAGLADLACQRIQAVRSNKTAMTVLEQQAESVGAIVEAVAMVGGDVHTPEFNKSTQTLSEVAEFLDKGYSPGSKKRRWRLLLSANRDKERMEKLHTRLAAALHGLSATINISTAEEIKKLRHDLTSQSCSYTPSSSCRPVEVVYKIIPHNMLLKFIKIFGPTHTWIPVAFFS
ncbi:hypothetical protein C8F04DRAFT_1140920 [Mycena alexandri]|uniref:Uncharacterized protein n=1 Tax=Mycena alexandri TaxID=1745969 RepID=A0AAD6WQM2_9AGAR|nr:hypothetical protein C8F04DRAFT_1140920 [Mycena alexandri]